MTSENKRGTIMSQRYWPACTRPAPGGVESCKQPYDHTGPCDWFEAAALAAAPLLAVSHAMAEANQRNRTQAAS